MLYCMYWNEGRMKMAGKKRRTRCNYCSRFYHMSSQEGSCKVQISMRFVIIKTVFCSERCASDYLSVRRKNNA